MSGPSYCRRELRRLLIAGTTPDWLRNHCRRRYIVSAVLASPPWINRKDFDALVYKRDQLTRMYKIPHVLDHVVPLNHPKVCGLNVPWNIEVLPSHANARKSNVWYDEPVSMFPAFEQFQLFA
jgi:5-methylcytosine-specific restriction endonuclease McrA